MLLLLFVMAVLLPARENSIRFEEVSSKQSRSQGPISVIRQDSRGFVWFGTQTGLSRFNGYTFTNFKFKPNDPHSLPVNSILEIYEDRSKILWVGTDGGGLNRFNRGNENFTQFRYNNPDDPTPGLGVDIISVIYEDAEGIFWLGTRGGLLRFDPKKNQWHRYHQKLSDPWNINNDLIFAICQDREGILWIGTKGGGLNAFDPRFNTFTAYIPQPEIPGSLSHENVNSLLVDSHGNLWVGTDKGLDRLDRWSGDFIHYKNSPDKIDSLSHNHVKKIFEDSRENIWIGTRGGGLNRLNSLPDKTFIRYEHQSDNLRLSNNIILSITEDTSKSIWIGTMAGGIYRIDQRKQQFGHFKGTTGAANSITSNDITAIYRDRNGLLWIGTNDMGLNSYDENTETFKSYRYKKNDAGSLSGDEITAVYQDRAGNIWVGTWGRGFNRFHPETETFTRYMSKNMGSEGPGSNDIFCFYGDTNGYLWIGTWKGGLNRFNVEKNEFLRYRHDPNEASSISDNSVLAFHHDPEDNDCFWIGTYYSGLEHFNSKTQTFSHFPNKPGNNQSLSHNRVLCIFISESNPQIIWASTSSGGLNRFNRKTGEWRAFTEDEGLSDNTVYSILEDKQGLLWMSTNQGLSRYNPTTGNFTNYDGGDGLQGQEFNQGAYFKDVTGRFYFGGTNGFNRFFPHKITPSTFVPPVVITAIKVFNNDVELEKSILETSEIRLSYTDYLITFEFAALNYIATTKIEYAYMIEGYDDDWIRLGQKRDISIRGLNHGDYVFRVKSTNNDGVWNQKGAFVKLIITPPFWLTWWFKTLGVILVLGIVLAIYKIRVRQFKKQRSKLETMVALRTREILQQNLIIEEKNSQLQTSNRDLKKSEENLLEFSKQLETSNLDLKKSEENLLELNATKDKFFSIISHDLRNHLTTLMLPSDLLANMFDQIEDKKKLKYSKAINKSANQLYELLENLLQWARSQRGILKCKPEPLDLNLIIPETMAYYSLHAKKKKIQMQYSPSESTIIAYADRDMVTTVVRNLVSNAIKFTKRGGIVKISAEISGDWGEITVADSGVGVANEKVDSLFRVGMNQSTRGTEKEKGTGLGLILCKEFIEKNNGKIWYVKPEPSADKDDETPQGSIFRFTLPRSALQHETQ